MGDRYLLAVLCQIEQKGIRVGIRDTGSDRDPQCDVGRTRTVLLTAAPILTSLAAMGALVAIIHECVDVFIGHHVNAGTFPAVAAIGPTAWNMLFATKNRHPLTAFPGN